MNESSDYGWEAITEDDETIRAALEHANAPVLLASLVHLTGDLELLHGEIQVDMRRAYDLQCGISEVQQAEVQRMAIQALRAFRERGCPAPTSLGVDGLREVLHFLTGQEPGDDYVPLLMEEIEFASDNAYGQPGFERIPDTVKKNFNVIIVGAGMSGLLAGFRLNEAGIPFTIFERRAEVGGTWLDNVYPGCRVDNFSHLYEYSFARHDWPQYFCSQPVLRDYFARCATDFGIRPHIRFEHEVEEAEYDEESGTWTVRITDKHGVGSELEANALISVVGQLNRPRLPDIDGRDGFAGPAFHSARWDTSLDLTGKRVAVIGTGASAMQLVPEIASQASEVLVFQRNPPWIYPVDTYRSKVPDGERWLLNRVPYYARWYRFLLFWLDAEGYYSSLTKDPAWAHQERSVSASNQALRDLLTDSIKKELDEDRELLETAIPHYPPGGKRLLVDDGTWYRTLRRDDVQLFTDPIHRITPDGVFTEDGTQHDADVLIYATGFYASRFLWPMEIKGKNGRDLRASWGDDPRAYLGVVVPGYPNLFCVYGPNTNTLSGSTIVFSECAVCYIMGCIKLLLERGERSLECRQDVHDAYNRIVDKGSLQVAWGVSNVPSWYKNKAGGSPRTGPSRCSNTGIAPKHPMRRTLPFADEKTQKNSSGVIWLAGESVTVKRFQRGSILEKITSISAPSCVDPSCIAPGARKR